MRIMSDLVARIERVELSWHHYALALGMLGFIALNGWFLAPRFSDGNIYLYYAQAVSQGLLPYQDFFYSSPPLLPYLLAPFGLVFGFSWSAVAWVPIALSVVDALLIFAISRSRQSAAGAVVAALLYLSSFAVLATTDFMTDVHVVTTLVLLGYFFQERRHPLVAGIFYGLAVLTKLYALVIVVPLLGLLLWRQRRDFAAAVAGTVGVIGIVTIFFWFLMGSAFFTAVIGNNLGRAIGIPKIRIMNFFVRHDPVLLLGLLFVPIFWRRLTLYLLLPIVGLLVFYVGYPDIYYLYLKLFVVWLALVWAWGADQLLRRFPRHAPYLLGIVVVSSLVLSSVLYLREQARAAVIADLPAIARYVQEETRSDTKLYGDFEIAPLVALESERDLWRHMADTNIKFFLNGVFDAKIRTQEIKEAQVPIIVTKAIVQGKQPVTGFENVLPAAFFTEHCHVGKVFPIKHDYSHNAIVVWKCRYSPG